MKSDAIAFGGFNRDILEWNIPEWTHTVNGRFWYAKED